MVVGIVQDEVASATRGDHAVRDRDRVDSVAVGTLVGATILRARHLRTITLNPMSRVDTDEEMRLGRRRTLNCTTHRLYFAFAGFGRRVLYRTFCLRVEFIGIPAHTVKRATLRSEFDRQWFGSHWRTVDAFVSLRGRGSNLLNARHPRAVARNLVTRLCRPCSSSWSRRHVAAQPGETHHRGMGWISVATCTVHSKMCAPKATAAATPHMN